MRRVAQTSFAVTRRRPSWPRLVPPLLLLGLGSWVARGFVGFPQPGTSSNISRAFFGGGAPTGSETPLKDAPAPGAKHFVKGSSMHPPWPAGMEEAMFGFGCFWCSENLYMKMPGVYSTQVGYAGGSIPNPSYRDVCTGASGHNEVVRVIFDPKEVSYIELLKIFWERHDPTTLNRQGNDMGTQYRSGIYYYNDAQREAAEATKARYAEVLKSVRRDPISTEIVPAPEFYYAEDYHQQYDAKPGSRQYCGLSPTGAKLDVSDMDGAPAAA